MNVPRSTLYTALATFGLVIALAGSVQASAPTTGTFTGTYLGPQGEKSALSYTFTNKATGVKTSGTTDANGVLTQTLDAGTYSLSIEPPTSVAGFEYAHSYDMTTVKVNAGMNIPMGTAHFVYNVPTGTDDMRDSFTQPAACSTSGTPVILGADWVDQNRGAFLYTGNDAAIKVVADAAGYLVQVDYSTLEGHGIGTNVVTATDNGDGSYTAHHTIVNTSMGGGVPVVTATNTGTSSTTALCMTAARINVDIRRFIDGADTTDFSKVTNFRELTGFTMHMKDKVKVVFTKAINMLDPTEQKFMMSLDQKLKSSTGLVNLDASAVLALKNAGAEVTLYNLPDYLSTPTILLNSGDAGSAVTGITYDRSAHSITFGAAHFSQYTVVPTLTVSAPVDAVVTSDAKTTIRGTVNDVTATVKITLGGTDQGTITVASDGSFSKEVSLALGSNSIVVTASNAIGDAPSITRTVTRQSLPVTGSSVTLALGLLALLVVSGSAYAWARRRQN